MRREPQLVDGGRDEGECGSHDDEEVAFQITAALPRAARCGKAPIFVAL
jgi:hypothetical protein